MANLQLKYGLGTLRRKISHSLFALSILALSTSHAYAACIYNNVHVKTPSSTASFTIEVASSNQTRAKGLMFVESMPKFSGMLFVYRFPQRVSFWMRNTLIPLDMIFINTSGVVTKVHQNAIPKDETPIFGGDSVFAVLELNGGMAKKLGIKEGAVLQHSVFHQKTAAWPCEN